MYTNIGNKGNYPIDNLIKFLLTFFIIFLPLFIIWQNIVSMQMSFIVSFILIVILLLFSIRNKIISKNYSPSKSAPGDYNCPKCGKKTLHVESDKSAYCDNCDYVTEEWER